MGKERSGLVDPNKSLIGQLGDDSVSLEKQELAPDNEASGLLRKLGAVHAEPGMKYAGTVAIHFYVESEGLIGKDKYSCATITHQTWKENISEALVATGLNNATIDIRTNFNPNYKFKTNRKNDKRGTVKNG